MSEPKDRREIELLVEALDEVPDDADAAEAVQRLGIDVKSWATEVRALVATARGEARKRQFAEAAASYQRESDALGARSKGSPRSKEEQQHILRRLLDRAPKSGANAVHFLKFEEATSDELAEMIRSLRHLLGEADE
jgi:hypothetical protein